jgi:subfamily B ATP-binding cassette protein MsbA
MRTEVFTVPAITGRPDPVAKRLLRIWPYFRRPAHAWIAAAVGAIVLSLTEPLIPALMQPLLDTGFQKRDLELWMVPVCIILIFGVRGLSNFIAQMALAKVANLGLFEIRKAMFARLLEADFSLFKNQSSSTLSNTVVYEVQAGAQLLVQALMTLARDSLTLLALLTYLMYLNWKLTLIVALLFPAVAWVMKTLTKRLYSITKQGQSATDALAYVIEENVLTQRDIRLYAAQGAQQERFERLGGSLNRLFMKSTAAAAAMTPLTQLLSAVALSAVITVALMQSQSSSTTVGSFAAFVTAMLMLIAPVKHLSEVANPLTRGLAAIEKGIDLLVNVPAESSGIFTKSRASGAIKFEHASVVYDAANPPALDDFSLDIQPGETIALVGSSGAGKTTLVNLLPRFVTNTAGLISLDGVALGDWNLVALRAQFAQVSQHVFMLNDSIAANVSLGGPIDRLRVLRCLEAANLGDYVRQSTKGLDTVVGHNAMELSGGQRQRIAIARALYKDAPVLILDEATSALDTESERLVQEALQRLMQGRTTLVIAHRLSTVQHADRIVVMHHGKVLEIGTHQELLAQDGHYAKLYRMGLHDSAIP